MTFIQYDFVKTFACQHYKVGDWDLPQRALLLADSKEYVCPHELFVDRPPFLQQAGNMQPSSDCECIDGDR